VALNDPARRRAVERDGDYFVVEGVLAIERLLDLVAGAAPGEGWRVRTMAVLPRVAERLAPRLAAATAAGHRPEVAVVEEAELRAVVGFDLHRGALASVARRPPLGLDDAVARLVADPARPLLVVEGVNDHENLGALYRNAAAFGAAAVALDPTSANPFYRRSVRVSLGHVLAVPTAAVPPLGQALPALHAAGVATVALTPAGDVDLRRLDRAALGGRPVAVVVGAEGPGLSDAALAAAEVRAAIEMAPGVDSLNVATAAAIALFQLSLRSS
jgi:tRNA G18 (ribose-2'-O)-methylase SpoU